MEPLDTMDKVRHALYTGNELQAEHALWVASYGFTRLTGRKFSGFGGGEFLAPGNMRFEGNLSLDMEHCLALNALYRAADSTADPEAWATEQIAEQRKAWEECNQ